MVIENNPFKNEPETLKSQKIHEGKLLEGGATYDEQGHLMPTEDQINHAKLEMHGEVFDNAIDFVKLNKKIVVPETDFWLDLKDIDKKEFIGKGWFFLDDNNNDFTFRYFDKDGNICDVDSSKQKIAQKISSISSKEGLSGIFSNFKKELGDYGMSFSFNSSNDEIRKKADICVEKHKENQIDSIKNKKDEGFDL